MSVVECPKPTFHEATVPVRYAIDDQIIIEARHTHDHDLDVWIPLIPDTPFQRLLDLAIEANCVCWAELSSPGWAGSPVDASCACKYGTEGLFGELETNHVVRRPRPAAGAAATGLARALFAAPYAEVDDQPYRAVERRVTFAEQ